jgi:hypothetical protein
MPVLELLAVVLGSMCGSGGVVYQSEREWMDRTFIRKTA